MSRLSPWFGRAFPAVVDVALHPNLCARLAGAPARVDEVVARVDAARARRRDGERWSIQEHVGHLGDLEPLWAQRCEQLVRGAAELAPADLENRATHEAGHNDADLAGLGARFRGRRERLVARLDGLADADFARTARHPRLQQPMRLIDLMHFVAEHDDHHLARIRELVAARQRPW